MNEDMSRLEEACRLLVEKADAEIKDVPTRNAVRMLLEAHENAKQVISALRGQLERTYAVLEKITSHPEFRKIMEECKDGEA